MTEPPVMEKVPDQSDISSATLSELSEPEPQFSSEEELEEQTPDQARQAVRDRLYAHKRPARRAKRSPPRLEELHYRLLKEHVRLMNGKSPRLVRKQKLVCWMDSPEIRPKGNRTTDERKKFILGRLEERKDSEENASAGRCVH